MVFGKRAFFAYSLAPDGTIYWFANPPQHEELTREQLTSICAKEWRASLIDLFKDDDSAALRIIDATPAISPPWAIYDMPSLPAWHRGAMIVIGDAAHATSPSSGQGASMAIEDGVVLSKCLRDFSISSAFENYEHLRRKRVERVVAYGARAGSGKTVGALGGKVRDLLMPFFLKKFGGPKATSWVTDYTIDWNTQ